MNNSWAAKKFTRELKSGLLSHKGTEAIAAKLITDLMSWSASFLTEDSDMSPSITVNKGWEGNRVPDEKLSKTLTFLPWERRAEVRWWPMKPAPPVTRTVSDSMLLC